MAGTERVTLRDYRTVDMRALVRCPYGCVIQYQDRVKHSAFHASIIPAQPELPLDEQQPPF